MAVVRKIGRKNISGWVLGDHGHHPTVDLCLNGRVIAQTAAGRFIRFKGAQRDIGFKFRVDALWDHLGQGDRLQIVCNNAPLLIDGYGVEYVHNEGVSRSPELLAKLDKGFVFSKKGALIRELRESSEWQEDVFGLFESLRAAFRQRGYDLTVSYGTLLGAVREQNFVKNDDDFDVAYISRHSTPGAVKRELLEIAEDLIARGFYVRLSRRVLQAKRNPLGAHIDIFHSWFDQDGEYQCAYGHCGPAVKKSADFGQFMKAKLGSRDVLIPGNSEALLEQFYGPNWRIPDQGFSHRTKAWIVDKRFWATDAEIARIYWGRFYSENRLDEPSPFARFLKGRLKKDSIVIDIGCGSGRDAVYFSSEGFVTVGLDYSAQAIRRARELQGSRRAPATFMTMNAGDVVISSVLNEIVKGAKSAVLYMRFFLHAVEETVEDTILKAAAGLPNGTMIAAEFRTIDDKSQITAVEVSSDDDDPPKIFGRSHYRRLITPRDFVGKLKNLKFAVIYQKQGVGLSRYEGEDPHLCRVIAVKGRPSFLSLIRRIIHR